MAGGCPHDAPLFIALHCVHRATQGCQLSRTFIWASVPRSTHRRNTRSPLQQLSICGLRAPACSTRILLFRGSASNPRQESVIAAHTKQPNQSTVPCRERASTQPYSPFLHHASSPLSQHANNQTSSSPVLQRVPRNLFLLLAFKAYLLSCAIGLTGHWHPQIQQLCVVRATLESFLFLPGRKLAEIPSAQGN